MGTNLILWGEASYENWWASSPYFAIGRRKKRLSLGILPVLGTWWWAYFQVETVPFSLQTHEKGMAMSSFAGRGVNIFLLLPMVDSIASRVSAPALAVRSFWSLFSYSCTDFPTVKPVSFSPNVCKNSSSFQWALTFFFKRKMWRSETQNASSAKNRCWDSYATWKLAVYWAFWT